MVGKDFEVGDLVWAQMKSYPPWPSKIAEPPNAKSSNTKKAQHYVYFFGSKNYAWIADEKISPHGIDMIKKANLKKKTGTYQIAIDEITAESLKSTEKQKSYTKVNLSTDSVKSNESDNEKKIKEVKSKKSSPQSSKVLTKKVKKVVSKKRSAEMNGISPGSLQKIKKESFAMTDKSLTSSFVPIAETYSTLPLGILQRGKYLERPQTPPLDIMSVRDTLLAKNVKPTNMKIGFLGLGPVGRGIVKNLLNSGHKVTVWNATPTYYSAFAEAGALSAKTPADVIETCDITFCCVSDPNASKNLVFGNCGVLKGLEGCTPLSKGYIELTGIDSETSHEIAKEICCKGGRYLEAPVSGSRIQSEDGQLLVLAAGDKELFSACKSCFSAFSKHAYFVSLQIGYACKMSLILSTFQGSVIASLAEAITLINRCKLCPDTFLSILDLTSVNSQLMQEKGRAMSKREYATDIELKHQQKDLDLTLSLAESLDQPLFLASSVNEIYKRAKLRCYEAHDVSAVIEGTRH